MSDRHATIDPRGHRMHFEIRPGDVPRFVLTPGDPGLVPVIGWECLKETTGKKRFFPDLLG